MPAVSDSNIMFALSVSISAISWPFSTSSPSETSHLRMVPSSMESDSRGMVMSVAMGVVRLEVAERGECGLHDVLLVRHGGLLQWL